MAAIEFDRSFLLNVDLASLIELETVVRFGKPAGNGTKRTVKGPCFNCGGEDRFAVFIGDDIQRYKCGIHGHGCEAKGDAIDFLRDYKKMGFNEAVATLKGETVILQPRRQWVTGAQEDAYKAKAWQEWIADFCKEAEQSLKYEGQGVFEYLLSRGLTEDTIRKVHLGMRMYKGRNIAVDVSHEVPCLVIPWYDAKEGLYTRVTLRDIRTGIDPKNRYTNAKGSAVDSALYLSDSLDRKLPVIMVEGELDALSIIQEAGDIVSVVATGTTTGGRSMDWIVKLATMPHVFVAFDAEDKGEKSAEFWLNALDNASQWRTPIGKDANEMLMQGLNVRLWVQAALSTLEPVETVATNPPLDDTCEDIPFEEDESPLCSECANEYRETVGKYIDSEDLWHCDTHWQEMQSTPEQDLPPLSEQEELAAFARKVVSSLPGNWTASEPMNISAHQYIEQRKAEMDEQIQQRKLNERPTQEDYWENVRRKVARPASLPTWLVPNSKEWNDHIDFLSLGPVSLREDMKRMGLRPQMTRQEALADMAERRHGWLSQNGRAA